MDGDVITTCPPYRPAKQQNLAKHNTLPTYYSSHVDSLLHECHTAPPLFPS